MNDEVGKAFQAGTKHRRETLRGYQLDWDARPPTFKIYSGAPLFELPGARSEPGATPQGDGDLWSVVSRRRSVRRFSAEEGMTQLELSRLLWAGAGVTRATPHHLFRAAPSAGGLYPIETYLVVNRVTGLPPGLYHYRVAAPNDDGVIEAGRGHALEQLQDGPLGNAIAQAALGQDWVANAAVVFIWTAVFTRARWKYRERAFRYVYLDAGHIAAQVSLAAVAQGLGSCQIAAFFDEEVDGLVGIDGEDEGTVYMTAVGRPLTDKPA